MSTINLPTAWITGNLFNLKTWRPFVGNRFAASLRRGSFECSERLGRNPMRSVHFMTLFQITCEHGGNQVPAEYASLFAGPGANRMLNSHRGYDPGAMDAAVQFANGLAAGRIDSETTRLLVDLNRSLNNPSLFSKFTSKLSTDKKSELLNHWYHPYRDQVTDQIEDQIKTAGQVVHLSIHTFTPRFRGQWRPIDVGLLFDPKRSTEQVFCDAWRLQMQQHHPRIRVVANQPYLGTDDGFTGHLRQLFPSSKYLGIEVEINHRYWKRSVDGQRKLVQALLQTIPN